MFTDAAREEGTGYGGHSPTMINGSPSLLAMGKSWPQDIGDKLRNNILSMPAGETFGAVVVADATIRALGNVTHLTLMTDCIATASTINSGGSGSMQLNALALWLFERHPRVQFLGIHLPGVANGAADSLSRGRVNDVVDEAKVCGTKIVWLYPHRSAFELLRSLSDMPQR